MATLEVTTQALAETMGAIQIGVLFNSFLFGILFMQWVSYFTSKFNDSWPIRALVFWIIAVDVSHVAVSWQYIWMYTVDQFGNFATLYAAHWQYDTSPIFIVLTAVPTQMFLVNRTRKMLGRQHPLLANGLFALVTVLGIIQLVLGLYESFSLLITVKSTAQYAKFIPIAVAWESTAIAADMTVMLSFIATLVYRRTGFKQTDWMLFNLMLVAVECALPVTLFTIGHIAAVINSPTTGMHQLFAWSQARLYSNTLFLNLNSRNKLRKGQESTHGTSGNVKEVNFLSIDRHGISSRGGPQVHVDVTREQSYAMDDISSKHIDPDFKPDVGHV
ncbi:hypothetical protein BT96DRAFT_427767 [Gymnopus androsaceus JB14]|uniref:DUF6534 domain-containing protein n=1 Tax=Gymnopus androsaceus JB14 TaxID=1447944 RepID=A0A6A4I388_9AGAR|nr:hypothetical protein BT96DRAFT_427767 [Gymnopus androsaceus JB14]